MFDDVEITINCPNCGKKIKEKVGRVDANGGATTCGACRTRITVNTKQFREATKPVDDLKKLFK